MRRRLLLSLLTCAGLVAGGCSSGDDGAATGGVTVATPVPTRARLPVAPSTAVAPTVATRPPTTVTTVATTPTTAPIDPKGIAVTQGAYAGCTGRVVGKAVPFPAPLVALDVAGAVRWSVCPGTAGEATEPVNLGPTVGAVLVANGDGSRTFFALTHDGAPAWSAPMAGSLLADHTSTAYAVNPAGVEPRTRALDAATGQERWNAPGEQALAARADAVVLLAGGAAPQLVVRDPASGAVRWTQPVLSAATTAGLAGNVVVAVSQIAGGDGATVPSVAVRDLGSGTGLWAEDLTGALATFVVDDALLVFNGDGTTTARAAANGRTRWSLPGTPLARVGGGGVTGDGHVFLGPAGDNPNVRVVEVATGTVRWTAGGSELHQQALGAGGGLLLFHTSLQGVEAVDLTTGAGRWSFDPPPSGTTTSHTNAVDVPGDLVLVAMGWTAR
jgi:hypothetical protein